MNKSNQIPRSKFLHQQKYWSIMKNSLISVFRKCGKVQNNTMGRFRQIFLNQDIKWTFPQSFCVILDLIIKIKKSGKHHYTDWVISVKIIFVQILFYLNINEIIVDDVTCWDLDREAKGSLRTNQFTYYYVKLKIGYFSNRIPVWEGIFTLENLIN